MKVFSYRGCYSWSRGEWKPIGVIDSHSYEQGLSLNGGGDLHLGHSDILQSVGSYPVGNKIIPHWHDTNFQSHSHSESSLPHNHKPFSGGFGDNNYGASEIGSGANAHGNGAHYGSGNGGSGGSVHFGSGSGGSVGGGHFGSGSGGSVGGGHFGSGSGGSVGGGHFGSGSGGSVGGGHFGSGSGGSVGGGHFGSGSGGSGGGVHFGAGSGGSVGEGHFGSGHGKPGGGGGGHFGPGHSKPGGGGGGHFGPGNSGPVGGAHFGSGNNGLGGHGVHFASGSNGQAGGSHFESGNALSTHHGSSLSNAEYQKIKSSNMLSPPPLPPVVVGKKPGFRKVPKFKQKYNNYKKKRPTGHRNPHPGFGNVNFKGHGGVNSGGLSNFQNTNTNGHFGKGSPPGFSRFPKPGYKGTGGKHIAFPGNVNHGGLKTGASSFSASGGNAFYNYRIKNIALKEPLLYDQIKGGHLGLSNYAGGYAGAYGAPYVGSFNEFSSSSLNYGKIPNQSPLSSGSSLYSNHLSYGEGSKKPSEHLTVNIGGGSSHSGVSSDVTSSEYLSAAGGGNSIKISGSSGGLGHEGGGGGHSNHANGDGVHNVHLGLNNGNNAYNVDLSHGEESGVSTEHGGFNGGNDAHLSFGSEETKDSYENINSGSSGQSHGGNEISSGLEHLNEIQGIVKAIVENDVVPGQSGQPNHNPYSSGEPNLANGNGEYFGFLNLHGGNHNGDASGILTGQQQVNLGVTPVPLGHINFGIDNAASSTLLPPNVGGTYGGYVLPAAPPHYAGASSSHLAQENDNKEAKGLVHINGGLRGDTTPSSSDPSENLSLLGPNSPVNFVVSDGHNTIIDHHLGSVSSVQYHGGVENLAGSSNYETDSVSGGSNNNNVAHLQSNDLTNHGLVASSTVQTYHDQSAIGGSLPYQSSNLVIGTPVLLNGHYGEALGLGLQAPPSSVGPNFGVRDPNVITLTSTGFPSVTTESSVENLLSGSPISGITHQAIQEGVSGGGQFSGGNYVGGHTVHGTRGGGKHISDNSALSSSQLHHVGSSSDSNIDLSQDSSQDHSGFVLHAYGVLDDSSTFTCGKNHYHNTKYHTATFQVADNDHPSSIDVIKYNGDSAVLVRSQNPGFHNDILPQRKSFDDADDEKKTDDDIITFEKEEKSEKGIQEKTGRSSAYHSETIKNGESSNAVLESLNQYNHRNTKPQTFTNGQSRDNHFYKQQQQQSDDIKNEDDDNKEFKQNGYEVNEDTYETYSTPGSKPDTVKNLLHPQFSKKSFDDFIEIKSSPRTATATVDTIPIEFNESKFSENGDGSSNDNTGRRYFRNHQKSSQEPILRGRSENSPPSSIVRLVRS
ncbi:hypothetical protein Phum_PHUM427230 [Pediculus humanus corporis]|uniref:Uncharacterized protein n=1 Tax=Pediculus humanus subsp. corporis TaxID=121224 RepID=E0VT62_PEDHC|nr:uncharacterized protein Phum_PHUM427230 [Pediculus humanus corporis]EEB16568.1 hypothetical protein Phum_PHUM427230 [Pediculus humanus corporis]